MADVEHNNVTMYSVIPQAFMNAILWRWPQVRWHIGGSSPRVNIVNMNNQERWDYDHPYGWFTISVEDGDETTNCYHMAAFTCDVSNSIFAQRDDNGDISTYFKYCKLTLWFRDVDEYRELQALLSQTLDELGLDIESIYIDPDNDAVTVTIQLVTTDKRAAYIASDIYGVHTNIGTTEEEYDDYE